MFPNLGKSETLNKSDTVTLASATESDRKKPASNYRRELREKMLTKLRRDKTVTN